jgi:hypothetical protein
MRIGLFAIDHGPRAILQKLDDFDDYEVVNNALFADAEYDGIVIGTSGSQVGVELESKARLNAKRKNIPMIIIEDYPGNYKQIDGGIPDLLIVEHEFSYDQCIRKYGTHSPVISIIPNPRYDDLRNSAARVYSELLGLLENNEKPEAVIWAGQPETEDALITLNQIMPIVKSSGIKFLFKAHPRDKGYEKGEYAKISHFFADLWEDVSSLNLLECIKEYNPRIILTHYSSLSIEAGFYGIPTINILFKNSGGKALHLQKGYSELPWCLEGGAVSVNDVSSFQVNLAELLFDMKLRQTVLSNFIYWFSDKPSSRDVVTRINQFISNKI